MHVTVANLELSLLNYVEECTSISLVSIGLKEFTDTPCFTPLNRRLFFPLNLAARPADRLPGKRFLFADSFFKLKSISTADLSYFAVVVLLVGPVYSLEV